MAKIGQLGIGAYVPTQLRNEKKEDKKASAPGKAAFHSLINTGEEEHEKLMIGSAELSPLENPALFEDLIDRLFESGEELKRSPVEENLEEYKKNIRLLLNFVSNKSFNVVREKGVINPRTFKQKEFVNVELIDKKLDSLAVYIISRQNNQLEILRRVDEINGLVINVVR
ncbi:MAG: DUF327 family protein [Spirochaetales bacterium]|nr:DUF327 family protein [Spirochaetales bacterium]